MGREAGTEGATLQRRPVVRVLCPHPHRAETHIAALLTMLREEKGERKDIEEDDGWLLNMRTKRMDDWFCNGCRDMRKIMMEKKKRIKKKKCER